VVGTVRGAARSAWLLAGAALFVGATLAVAATVVLSAPDAYDPALARARRTERSPIAPGRSESAAD
jgi:hypothetical protein